MVTSNKIILKTQSIRRHLRKFSRPGAMGPGFMYLGSLLRAVFHFRRLFPGHCILTESMCHEIFECMRQRLKQQHTQHLL